MKDELKISEIINRHLNKSPYKDLIEVNEKDIEFDKDNQYINWKFNSKRINGRCKLRKEDKIGNLFTKKLKIDRKNDQSTFYHFKCYDIALSIIKNREIQLSSLTAQFSNDSAEFHEFIHRYGNQTYPDLQSLNEIPNNIFVFCFTELF